MDVRLDGTWQLRGDDTAPASICVSLGRNPEYPERMVACRIRVAFPEGEVEVTDWYLSGDLLDAAESTVALAEATHGTVVILGSDRNSLRFTVRRTRPDQVDVSGHFDQHMSEHRPEKGERRDPYPFIWEINFQAMAVTREHLRTFGRELSDALRSIVGDGEWARSQTVVPPLRPT